MKSAVNQNSSIRRLLMPADQSLPALQQTATCLPAGSEAGVQPGQPTGPRCSSRRRGSSGLGDAEHLPPVAGWAQRLVSAAPGPAQCQVKPQPSRDASLCFSINHLPQPTWKTSPNGLSQMFPFIFIPSAEVSKMRSSGVILKPALVICPLKMFFFVVTMMLFIGSSPYATAHFTAGCWGIVPFVKGSGYLKSRGPWRGNL